MKVTLINDWNHKFINLPSLEPTVFQYPAEKTPVNALYNLLLPLSSLTTISSTWKGFFDEILSMKNNFLSKFLKIKFNRFYLLHIVANVFHTCIGYHPHHFLCNWCLYHHYNSLLQSIFVTLIFLFWFFQMQFGDY